MHIEVVCAVLVQQNRVLAARRSPKMKHAGLWELPGGKVHNGETKEEALKREMLEEFNVIIDVNDIFHCNSHNYDDFSINLTAFWCSIASGGLTPLEHSEIRWLGASELFPVNWSPADVPIIEQLQKFLLQ